jgi:serine/threonine-protein kinase
MGLAKIDDRRRAPNRIRDASKRRIGKVLNGKWHLDALLGVGGMAAVYAATHRNGNRVAVKVLHDHCAADESLRSRFQREGYVANKIHHAGAVRVLDDDQTEDGTVFLVMDLLEGETLQARFKRTGPFTPCEAGRIIHPLLDVLAAAHDKGIVHRDIKLDNVFLTSGGEVRVLDFGIARLVERSHECEQDRTRTGCTVGTPAFMAPEQALGRSSEIDAQTDLWAVGATLFKLVTGRCVHEATTVNELLVQAATRPAPPLRSILDTAPADLAWIVDRALAFDKAKRWARAEDMQEALAVLIERGDPIGSPRPPPPSDTSSPSSLTPSWVTREVAQRISDAFSGSVRPTGSNVAAEIPQRTVSHGWRLSALVAGAAVVVLAVALAMSRPSMQAPVAADAPQVISSGAAAAFVERPHPEPASSVPLPNFAPTASVNETPARPPPRIKAPRSSELRLVTDDEATFGKRH